MKLKRTACQPLGVREGFLHRALKGWVFQYDDVRGEGLQPKSKTQTELLAGL